MKRDMMKRGVGVLLMCVLLGGAAALGVGCNRDEGAGEVPKTGPGSGGAILKLSMAADGKIKLDGKDATLADVDKAIDELGKKQGTVLYYRVESADQMTDPFRSVAMLLSKHQVLARASMKPDFSDQIGSDGKLIPR